MYKSNNLSLAVCFEPQNLHRLHQASQQESVKFISIGSPHLFNKNHGPIYIAPAKNDEKRNQLRYPISFPLCVAGDASDNSQSQLSRITGELVAEDSA